MLARILRLHQPGDFARLRASGRVYRHSTMLLSVLPNGLSHNRYGFITSKQIGGAVLRNRTRRLLREAIFVLHPRIASGNDFVLIARRELTTQSLMEYQLTIELLLRQARLVV